MNTNLDSLLNTDAQVEINQLAMGMLVHMRGGIPECCDFCGEKFTEERYPTPEECGDWACIECVKKWEAEMENR